MFNNHPDAGYLPITLLISTREFTEVAFVVRSIEGVIMEGNVSSDQSTEVLLPNFYVVSSLNDTIGKGLSVETVNTSSDISVSVSSHYAYSSDSYLALPLIDYVDIDLYTYYAISPDTNATDFNHRVLLVGGYNDTVVTAFMTSNANISTDVVSDGILIEGQLYSFQLNELDTVMIESWYPLTGSKFTTNNPITFISGHQCAVVPETGNSCDFAIEQYPPTITWGKAFVFPMLASRMGGSYVSILSSYGNTVTDIWCYSNSSNVNISDTIYFEYSGDYINVLVAPDDVYCSVVGNNSIMVTLIGATENNDDSSGDPFMMIIPPVEQFYNNVSINPNCDFSKKFINIMSAVNDTIEFNGALLTDFIAINTAENMLLGFATQVEISDDFCTTPIEVSSDDSLSFAANVYGFNFSVGYGQVSGMNFLITKGSTVNKWFKIAQL